MTPEQQEAAARHFCKLNGWDPDKPIKPQRHYFVGGPADDVPKWKHLLMMTGGSITQDGEWVPFSFVSWLQMMESVIEAVNPKETQPPDPLGKMTSSPLEEDVLNVLLDGWAPSREDWIAAQRVTEWMVRNNRYVSEAAEYLAAARLVRQRAADRGYHMVARPSALPDNVARPECDHVIGEYQGDDPSLLRLSEIPFFLKISLSLDSIDRFSFCPACGKEIRNLELKPIP